MTAANMSSQPVLIAGEWCTETGVATFSAANPRTGKALAKRFPRSTRATLERALDAAAAAARDLAQAPPEQVAGFLERCARNLEERKEALVGIAHEETGFPREPRLASIELPRTTGQLRQAAQAVLSRSHCAPTLDLELDIRSMFCPLVAPVLVLGPNNFPFAFNGVMGGDFAAAIATQNPVIAKAHPGHPETTRLLAEAAFDALRTAQLPLASVQMFYDIEPELGLELVADRRIGATAFTGSRRGGLALKAAADRAGRPIYLEMSSINPVFVLPGALEERASEVARELFGSCTLGAGQFCTNPGLSVVVDSPASHRFIDELRGLFEGAPGGCLLSAAGVEQLETSVATLVEAGARLVCGGKAIQGPAFSFQNTLLTTEARTFLEHPRLQTEAFGSVHLVVVAHDTNQMAQIAAALEGNLTGSVYSHRSGTDDEIYRRVAEALAPRVGRLLNDKMPTGVAVSPAMHHGGPYPATGHPGFTSVGIPASLRRFTALRCYDQVRTERLPPELRDDNPTACWRFVDGVWTNLPVGGASA